MPVAYIVTHLHYTCTDVHTLIHTRIATHKQLKWVWIQNRQNWCLILCIIICCYIVYSRVFLLLFPFLLWDGVINNELITHIMALKVDQCYCIQFETMERQQFLQDILKLLVGPCPQINFIGFLVLNARSTQYHSWFQF